MMAGYCFFNNAAIAAKRLSRNGDVAILDIDIHHGNGTQNIFYSTDRVFYVSLHAHPRIFPYLWGFPSERGVGDGLGFNRNFILPDNITENSYLTIADEALLLIREFDPKRVIISAGFDTFKDDPVSKNSGVRSKLGVRFYERLSRRISRTLDVPTLIVQEGGYNVGALGQCVMSFLNGFR
jgi:acetoin utilization deacetylase AcuC-like enzyme